MARNCGLLARDLTEAAFVAGSRGRETYNSYYSDDHPTIAAAERAITDRISGLERDNAAQAKRIKQLEDGYDELRTVCNRLHAATAKKETDSVF